MVEFQNSPEKVTVFYAEKAVDFRRDGLPADWETLLRDPDIAECVNDVILEKGAPRASSRRPQLGWDEVTARLAGLAGSTG